MHNNPHQYIDEISFEDPEHPTREEAERAARVTCEMFMRGTRRARDPAMAFTGAVLERGDTGNLHVQQYVEAAYSIKLKTLQHLWPHAHLEKARGDHEANRKYISKEGVHEAKAHTQLGPPVFMGDYAGPPPTDEGRVPLSELDRLLDLGLTPQQIVAKGVGYAKEEKAILAAYKARTDLDIPIWRDIQVNYSWGSEGVGKSLIYKELVEQFGEEEVYRVTSYRWPFDGYSSQSILVLDELRPSCIDRNVLLAITDGWRVTDLDARYSPRSAHWTRVELISPYPPEVLYGNSPGADTWNQLRRRLNTILYKYRRTMPDGTTDYRTLEVPGGMDSPYHDQSYFEHLLAQEDSPERSEK